MIESASDLYDDVENLQYTVYGGRMTINVVSPEARRRALR